MTKGKGLFRKYLIQHRWDCISDMNPSIGKKQLKRAYKKKAKTQIERDLKE